MARMEGLLLIEELEWSSWIARVESGINERWKYPKDGGVGV